MTVTSISVGPEIKYYKYLKPPPAVRDVRDVLATLNGPASRKFICDVHMVLHRHLLARKTSTRIEPSSARNELKTLVKTLKRPSWRRLPLPQHRISNELLHELILSHQGQERILNTARRLFKKLQSPPRGPQERRRHDELLIILISKLFSDYGFPVEGKFNRETAEPLNDHLLVIYKLLGLVNRHLTWQAFRTRWNGIIA
jgi:hypothetical protein